MGGYILKRPKRKTEEEGTMYRKRLRSLRPALRPINRRRSVGLFSGSLAVAAAGCRRGDVAYSRGNTLIMAVRDVSDVKYDNMSLQFLYCPRLAAENENGDLQPLLAQSWEHSSNYLEGRITCARTRAGLTASRSPRTT